MTIENKTTVTLEIMGNLLKPNQSMDYPERAFDKLSIHSDIGSCMITTEYSQRSIENYGKLVAEEGSKKNEYGMKNIIVSSLKAE